MTYNLRNKYFNQSFLLDKNMVDILIHTFVNLDSNKQDEYGTEEVKINYLILKMSINIRSPVQSKSAKLYIFCRLMIIYFLTKQTDMGQI